MTPHKLVLVSLSGLGMMHPRTLQKAEKCRDKEQRRNRREKQSTYDRPAKGSILFTTVPESQSHGHHADNHGQSGHQHWAKTRESGLQCGAD